MTKYRVKVEWSGYSRGTSVYELETETKEEAEELWYEGKRVEHVVVRDDTEGDNISVEEVEEEEGETCNKDCENCTCLQPGDMIEEADTEGTVYQIIDNENSVIATIRDFNEGFITQCNLLDLPLRIVELKEAK